MTEDDRQLADEERGGARVVLRAAALVVIGAINRGVAEVVSRVMVNWVNPYFDDGSPWAQRANWYEQRAYRALWPWWEHQDWLARRRAQRAAEWEANRGDPDA